MSKKKTISSAEQLDKRFEDGEDISAFLDWDRGRRPGMDQKRINVDLPVWMIGSLDREAKRIGVTRQSIIKVWLAERVKAEQEPSAHPVGR